MEKMHISRNRLYQKIGTRGIFYRSTPLLARARACGALFDHAVPVVRHFAYPLGDVGDRRKTRIHIYAGRTGGVAPREPRLRGV